MREKKPSFVWNRDRISSIVILLFSLGMIYQTGKIKPTYTQIGGNDPGSKLFPYAIAIIMIICAIGKLITCNKPDETAFLGGKKGVLRISIVIGIIFVYILLLPKLGFLLCTFLFAAILVYAMKDDRKVRPLFVLLFAAALTGALYTVFQTVLSVRFPVGTIWKLLG